MYSKEQVNKIQELCLAGKSDKEIATELKSNRTTIRNYRKSLGIENPHVKQQTPIVQSKTKFVKDMKRNISKGNNLIVGPLTPMLLTEEEVSFIRAWRKANGTDE